MRPIKLFFLLLSSLVVSNSFGQNACPPNLDFEFGNMNGWYFFTGTCCPINANVSSPATPNRHELTTGTATDPYGGFPAVSPSGGSFSLKLGNNLTGAQAERARYYLRVPPGNNKYIAIYRYAVVFQ